MWFFFVIGVGFIVSGLIYPTMFISMALWQLGHRLLTGEWWQSERSRRTAARLARERGIHDGTHPDACHIKAVW